MQTVDEVDAIERELGKRERKNTSLHSHYSHYYDEELRDLVARKKRSLIGNYDYQFEQIGPVDSVKRSRVCSKHSPRSPTSLKFDGIWRGRYSCTMKRNRQTGMADKAIGWIM